MNWYYSENKQQRGPVPAAELASLVARGKVAADALVWRDGLPNWVPLASVRAELGIPAFSPGSQPGTGTAPVSTSIGGSTPRCSECGFLFPSAEMLNIEGRHVCARCKPVFLQKLREGVPLGAMSGVWRRGREMVVALETSLPERCVRCNSEATGHRLKRQLYWHNPALYLLIFFPGLLIYAIVAAIVRKRATLHVGICNTHRASRRNAILTGWMGFVIGVATIVAGGIYLHNDEVFWSVLAGIVLILGGAIYGVVRSRVIYAKRIDTTHAYIGGVCPDFLATLPEWPNL